MDLSSDSDREKRKREKLGRRNLFIYSETQSGANTTVTAILLIPHRAVPPKGSLKSLENRRLKRAYRFC
jgi:hypothetical protein